MKLLLLQWCRKARRYSLAVRASGHNGTDWSALRGTLSQVPTRPASSLYFCIFMHLNRAPRLVAGVADDLQQAFNAFWLAGNAQLPSVPNDLMREQNPFFARDNAHQILLDFLRIGIDSQLKPTRDAVY